MLQFTLSDGVLRLKRGDTALYAIRPGDEPLRVGTGRNSFSMTRGSFTIRETDLTLRPLRVRGVTLSERTAELTLDEGAAVKWRHDATPTANALTHRAALRVVFCYSCFIAENVY